MTTFYCLRFETPPNWRARSPYLYPPGTGWPSYTPGHWVPFRRPLRFAGLRWRYSSPPPHGIDWVAPTVFLITHYCGPNRKHRFQQGLYCCARIHCSENVFTDPLLRNGLHNIVVYSPICVVHAAVLYIRQATYLQTP
jgi:hypothetical protein